MPSERIVGAFVFPEFWSDLAGAKEILASLRECGVNAIMTESDAYDPAAIDETHEAGLRFYAGVACFSDHASNFRLLERAPRALADPRGRLAPRQARVVRGDDPDRPQAPGRRAGKNRRRRADAIRSTGSFSISCAGRSIGKSNSGLVDRVPWTRASTRRRSAKFEEATGMLPRAGLGRDVGESGVDPPKPGCANGSISSAGS